MGKTLWRSPNKKWEIVDETDGLRHKTDWDDGFSTVAEVSASDGWGIAYASIDVNGRIWTGDHDTNWEYFVPKTVQERAFSKLRSIYKAKKSATGKAQLPFQYAVIVVPVGTKKGTNVPKPTFYRTFETAKKHAESEWQKLSPYQKSNGAFVNVGRLSKSYASSKDVPASFGYSLMGSITNSYNSFVKPSKKRRN